MGTTDRDAALAVIQSTSAPIHDIGTTIYLSPDVFGWAAEWGWSNPFSFYFAGRGGMLGDVGAEVVCSAFGWFEPSAVKASFEEGAEVGGARVAAERMAEAHGMWGRKYLGDVKGLSDIVAVTETLVDGLEGSGLPLFAGWRAGRKGRRRCGTSGAAHADPAGVERRGSPGRHHRRRTDAPRSDTDQRRRRAGEVLRMAGAIPGLRRDPAQA